MRLGRPLLGIGVLLAVAASLAVWGRAPRQGRPNVILISIDALRPDHLGAYGYHRDLSPQLDSLAAQGTRFADAISQATWTLPSVTSLFLSQYVSTHGVEAADARIPGEAQTLAEVLRAHGYATAAFVIGVYTSWDFGMDQGFTHFVGDAGRAEQRVALMRQWIEGRDQAKPFFLYAHFIDVHHPYRSRNPYGEQYGVGYRGFVNGTEPLGKIAAKLAPDDLQHLIDLYDNGVAHADFHVGRFLSWLRDAGLDAATLVILTADHGEAFLEHRNMLGHRGWPYEELIRVPLLMRGPGIPAGRVVSTPVEQIDLAPTILDFCAIEPGPTMQGRSLRPLLQRAGAHKPYTYSEFLPYQLKAIRSDAWKLIADHKTGAHELFDLRADGAERRNLAAERPEVVQELLTQLSSFATANLAWNRRPETAEVQPATREQLRALGYLDE